MNSMSFRNPARLTQFLQFSLYASIVIDVLALVSSLLLYQFILDVQGGVYSSRALITETANAIDKRQAVTGLLQTSILLITIVPFAIWIYRANCNVRQLGAQNLKFTPGWAVGYYFIPILNIWKPYQAMKEIWQASMRPKSWETVDRGAILPWWWFFYLANGAVGSMAFQAQAGAKGVKQVGNATIVLIGSDVVDIIAVVLALVLVKQIYRMQMANAQARV